MTNNLHELCVQAVNKMVEEGITRHMSFISPEDDISFGLKEGGKIPKVTIEWVDASEADPKKLSVADILLKSSEEVININQS